MKTVVINESEVLIDGVRYAKVEPHFKIGQWVIGENGFYPKEPCRIVGIEEGGFYYEDTKNRKVWEHYKVRPATHSEIESHLIKMAKEKGFKEGVTVKHQNYDVSHKIKGCLFSYGNNSDFLSLNDILIYEDGVWAKILPSKKPLPKDKEELRNFLIDWKYRSEGASINDFLNDYE